MSQSIELPLPLVSGAMTPPAVPDIFDAATIERMRALSERCASYWADPAYYRAPVQVLLMRWRKWLGEIDPGEAIGRIRLDGWTRPPVHWMRRRGRGEDPRVRGWPETRRIARTIADRVTRLSVMQPNPHLLVLADRFVDMGHPRTAQALRCEGDDAFWWATHLLFALSVDTDPLTTELLRGALGWTGMSARLYGEHEPGGGP